MNTLWLRDLDGSGSMHVCAKGDPGAVEYTRTQGGKQSSHTAGEGLAEHFPTGLRSKRHVLSFTGEVFESPIQCDCHCGASFAGSDEQEVRQLWADHAALSATQSSHADLLEALEKAEAAMTCRGGDAHYCPNCDNTTFNAREDVRAAIAQHKGQSK